MSVYEPAEDDGQLAAQTARRRRVIAVSGASALGLANEVALLKEKVELERAAGSTGRRPPVDDRARKKQAWKPNRGVKERAARDAAVAEEPEKDAQRILERKAKQYEALKRGYAAPGVRDEDVLIDVDMLPARRSDDDSSDDEDARYRRLQRRGDGRDDDSDDDMVTYEDEFGRTRRVSRWKMPRTYDGERGPGGGFTGVYVPQPTKLIYGDVIQHEAFTADEEAMREILTRDDTNDLEKHYDAKWEIRNKGVGFYNFSQDKKTRDAEMDELKHMREQTERMMRRSAELRKRSADRLARRRRVVDARRNAVLGDQFLQTLP
ncbi:uncharacterized protein V1510DRAFT_440659 [Dipodascopsis tothii]|uniref:uncharacterized protein n=1 Tax=Dipodascopsis tothii TaxID=44089 RepID=UPI0034CDE1B1